MSRVVSLHVGAPKTGTTYLQDRLALNRGALGEHDVHYPLGLHASHFRAALDLIDMSWGGQRDEVRGDWDSLMRSVRRHSGTVIVSHEILAAARADQVAKAMADLEGSEVHVVLTARDLARQIPAEWQEGVKHRRTRSFRRFLTQVQEARRTRPKLWFWRAQGLPDVLSRWSSGLPPERVHLVTVPQPGAPRDLLWERYCQAVGIDPAWAPEDSERVNQSIGAAETTLLRRFNRRLREAGVKSIDYRPLVRELMVHQCLAQREDMTRAAIPPEAFDWVCEVTEEWLEWIRGSGIDVVGDLEDLRPRRPATDEPWRDPDRPSNADMVDAALDALVAMTVEAASRPDPDEQLTSKLGRAAKRLRGQ